MVMACIAMTAVGGQQAVAGAEEIVVVIEAYRFEHFDADDFVEAALEFAIILEQQVDSAAGVARAGEELPSGFELLRG